MKHQGQTGSDMAIIDIVGILVLVQSWDGGVLVTWLDIERLD